MTLFGILCKHTPTTLPRPIPKPTTRLRFLRIPRNIQQYPHHRHKNQQGSTAIADKRQRDAGRRDRVGNNRDVNDDLACHGDDNTRRRHGAEGIRRVQRNADPPPDEYAKKQQHGSGAD